jgi:GNAT superfamily N-acetyltransferase
MDSYSTNSSTTLFKCGSPLNVMYQLEPDLSPDEFIDVLVRSNLAERRPVHDHAIILAMLKNADLILTARLDGFLVGVSRAITDFAVCTYLSDLAVDERHQRQGIGRELIRRTHDASGLHTTLILLAALKPVPGKRSLSMRRSEATRTGAGMQDRTPLTEISLASCVPDW